MDDATLDQIEQSLLTSEYNHLLGFISASLATAGVTINFGPGFAAHLALITIGLIGMVITRIRAKSNLKSITQDVHDAGYATGVNAGFKGGVDATFRGAADTVGKLAPASTDALSSAPGSVPLPQHNIPQPPPPQPLTDKIDQ